MVLKPVIPALAGMTARIQLRLLILAVRSFDGIMVHLRDSANHGSARCLVADGAGSFEDIPFGTETSQRTTRTSLSSSGSTLLPSSNLLRGEYGVGELYSSSSRSGFT